MFKLLFFLLASPVVATALTLLTRGFIAGWKAHTSHPGRPSGQELQP